MGTVFSWFQSRERVGQVDKTVGNFSFDATMMHKPFSYSQFEKTWKEKEEDSIFST